MAGAHRFGRHRSAARRHAARQTRQRLAELGFERITDADEALVEATKHAIMEHVRDADHCRLKISACIADNVGASYDTLSRIFSRHEGRTIEQYTMAQRVEYVKNCWATARNAGRNRPTWPAVRARAHTLASSRP